MNTKDLHSDNAGELSGKNSHPLTEVAATMSLGGLFSGLTMWVAGAAWGRSHHRHHLFQNAVMISGVVGAVSGLLAGKQKMYAWSTRRGCLAFVADHTWAVVTTGMGAITAGLNYLLGATVDESLTRRQNRLVFDRGFVLRPGFAVSVGYVVSGAADRQGVVTARRRKLVEVHEDVHIWQARRWGPLYPVLYGLWFIGGFFVGLQRWWVRRHDGRSLMTHIDATAYYSNPFEWRAYTEDDNWPPTTADKALVWSKRFGG